MADITSYCPTIYYGIHIGHCDLLHTVDDNETSAVKLVINYNYCHRYLHPKM